MKKLFLTSDIGSYKKRGKELLMTRCDNSNHFVDRLKEATNGSIATIAFVVATPRIRERNEIYAKLLKESLNLEGFGIRKVVLIDELFDGDLYNTIMDSDMVYLSRGHAATQNKFMRSIDLADILKDYDGVIVAQGSGSANCAKKVYAQPDTLLDMVGFESRFNGLGLVDFNVISHLNVANIRTVMGATAYSKSITDSYLHPHFCIADGSFMEVDSDGLTTAYGNVKYFNQGKCKTVCTDGNSRTVEFEKKTKVQEINNSL